MSKSGFPSLADYRAASMTRGFCTSETTPWFGRTEPAPEKESWSTRSGQREGRRYSVVAPSAGKDGNSHRGTKLQELPECTGQPLGLCYLVTGA